MFKIRLKELREGAGYKSQQAFANAFGVAQSTVGNWEAGAREPDYKTTKKLADFFGVTIDYLLGHSDEPYMYPVSPEYSLRGITDKDEIQRRLSGQVEWQKQQEIQAYESRHGKDSVSLERAVVLLDLFHQLNPSGQERLIDEAEMMVGNEKFAKNSTDKLA